MIRRIKALLQTENKRSQKINKNVLASFFIKGLSIIVGFVMVRVTLDYLDQTRYGIWLTLSSFLTWFSFFEIGLGSGLRNKLAEALAVKNYELGRIYVSTTYAILSMVIGGVAVVFFGINWFLDWSVILNTDPALAGQLSGVAAIVFGFFFLRFVIKLIGIVLYADQRPAMANLFGPLGNLLALIIIFILTKTTQGSLIYLGWVLSVAPILVLVVASFYFYGAPYRAIAPHIKYVRFSYSKDLLNLGVQFFFLQIIGLVLYQSSNIIITQYFGPAEVTVYNIAYKYFSTINMLFVIIITPFWSAFTEAWVKDEIDWIKKNIKNLFIVWFFFVFIALIMLLFSNSAYQIWIGNSIRIPFILSTALCAYFILSSLSSIFVYFLNGTGIIRLQIYVSVVEVCVFIVSVIIFLKYSTLGIEMLAFSLIIVAITGVLPMIIQYHKVINKRARGIWAK